MNLSKTYVLTDNITAYIGLASVQWDKELSI